MRRCGICAGTLIVLAGAACTGAEEPFGDVFASDVSLYSQLDEELIVRDFFQDKRGGVFLDVGCSTPIANSTTYYLEKHLGWTGIAVDALSHYGRAWEKTRPHSDFFAFAVTDKSGETVTFYQAEVPGVSSLSADTFWDSSRTPIEVPTITLTKLLDDNGVSKIDFLSLDIEGAETIALNGFDIDRFAPELVAIETGVTDENDRASHSYLHEHGYEKLERYRRYDHVNA
jgi:FkbM family methyltransferase